jgi:ADP-heptose:LPS heptosyltransferase
MTTEFQFASDAGRILVCAYTGIGDALICGPILRSLNKHFPGRILYPANPALKLYRELNIENLDQIEPIAHQLRRLVDFPPKTLIDVLKHQRVEVIFNLRRDRVRDGRYEKLAAHVNQAGVYLTDICEMVSPAEQTQLHVFDLLSHYFARLGMTVETYQRGWLRESIRLSSWTPGTRTGLCFYLGAGHTIKRMTSAFWLSLIETICSKSDLSLSLVFGTSDDEISQGHELSTRLTARRVPHRVISGVSLIELTRLVAGFDLIVSCDTFMVHLAEALGIDVVGIYCSTNPTVYGPYLKQNLFVKSSFYAECPLHNQLGNCDGWDAGCTDTPCKDFVRVEDAAFAILESLRSSNASRPLMLTRNL